MELERQFGVSSCVENDVNAAALAEATIGAGKGHHSSVYMTVSTGVAAGIVVEGQLIRGAHYCAGEIGNIIPDPIHLDRDWRPNGCLESTAAGIGLAQMYRDGSVDAEYIFAAAKRGEKDARTLVRRAIDYLAQAAVAIGSIIDPSRIILGGSIGLHQEQVAQRVLEVFRITFAWPPEVVPAALGAEAPLTGALLIAANAVN